MIKINLASRKTASLESKGKGLGLEFNLDLSDFKDPIFLRALAAAFALILAVVVRDDFETTALDEAQKRIERVTERQNRLQAQADGMKDLKLKQETIEADEKLIRTKLDVLKKLASDRGVASKLLLFLSQSTPPQTWLAEFKIADNAVLIRGSSTEYAEIPDFISSLSESAFFKDVKLVSIAAGKDGKAQTQDFEIAGMRR